MALAPSLYGRISPLSLVPMTGWEMYTMSRSAYDAVIVDFMAVVIEGSRNFSDLLSRFSFYE